MRNFNTFLVFRSPWPPQALRNCDTTLRSASLLQRISTCYLSLGHAHPWSPQPVRGVSTFHVFAPVGAIATPLFFPLPWVATAFAWCQHISCFSLPVVATRVAQLRHLSVIRTPRRNNRCVSSTRFYDFCPPWSPKPWRGVNALRNQFQHCSSSPPVATASRYTHWPISQTYPNRSPRLDHTSMGSKRVRTSIATRAAPRGSHIDDIALLMWHILADAPSCARRPARAGASPLVAAAAEWFQHISCFRSPWSPQPLRNCNIRCFFSRGCFSFPAGCQHISA